jgi:hypothetical protein
VTILRQSETEGTRLLGYIKIGRDKILGSVDNPHCLRVITEDYNVACRLELNKVNPDGPSLKFSARFSVSNFPDQKVSGLDLIGMPKNTGEIAWISLDHYLSYPQLSLLTVGE